MATEASARPGPMSPPVEKRAAPRVLAAALVPAITGLRLSPHGAEATLVNISATGLLAECSVRLKTGSALTVSFEGSFQPASAAGRVVRCTVAAMSKNGGLLYHVAIVFDDRIAIKKAAEAVTPDPVTTIPEPTPVRPAVRNRW